MDRRTGVRIEGQTGDAEKDRQMDRQRDEEKNCRLEAKTVS